MLILGSTPEFRDLLNSKGLTAYVCDYSRKNFEALEKLKKIRGEEELIEQDWTCLLTDKKFDIVLAEASLNVIKKHELPILLKNVHRILKDDGLFLAKTWIRIPKEQIKAKEMVRICRKLHNGKDLHHCLATHLYSLFYDTGKDTLSLKRYHEMMALLYSDGIITEQEFESFSRLDYDKTRLELYIPTEEEFFDTLSGHFTIISRLMPKQIGMNSIPIYVLKKQ